MPSAATLIVVGATGDLTGRLLLPALARLSVSGDLADDFAVVGAGPEALTPAEFRDHARTRLATYAPDLAATDRESFLRRVGYRQVDVTDPAAVAGLFGPFTDADAVVLYLALPTHLVSSAVAVLETLTLPPMLRIAVEKPFGEGLASAVALNAALRRINPVDDSVFRVDHVLGMPAIAALPALDAAVPPIPPGAQIEEISILWEETLALEGRAAFYDRAGALKDLLQNHLLQILCMITMDPQHSGSAAEQLATRRFRALQQVGIPTAADAVTGSRRARYTAGRLSPDGADTSTAGTDVPDYVAEAGVDPDRATETLAEVVLRVATPRWAGTRFVLRAGKAMARRRRGILVQYTTAPGDSVRQSWIDVDRSPAGARSAPGRRGRAGRLGATRADRLPHGAARCAVRELGPVDLRAGIGTGLGDLHAVPGSLECRTGAADRVPGGFTHAAASSVTHGRPRGR